MATSTCITTEADLKPPSKPKGISVCVLNCSYEGSTSPIAAYDDLKVGLQHYIDPSVDPDISHIEVHSIVKATSFSQIKALVSSRKFDVFYNLCDGSIEEDRAGIDVIRALEHFKVPFTGVPSVFFEMKKVDMKMCAFYNNIATPPYAYIQASSLPAGLTLDETKSLIKERCANLTFPCLIKHPMGYSSVGLTKDCKVYDIDALADRTLKFLEDWQEALIEEFIAGEEATVLACSDCTAPGGIRVFPPALVAFPVGEDFKHFDLKWIAFEGMEWQLMPREHPAYSSLVESTRQAFKTMITKGYARMDFRIRDGEPYFLEVNPSPGMMYPPGQEASADWIVKMDETINHRDFALLQMRVAIDDHNKSRERFVREFDSTRGYLLRATEDIQKGDVVFSDEGTTKRITTLPHVARNWAPADQVFFAESALPLGTNSHFYAVWDVDPAKWRPLTHHCSPNLAFDAHSSLNVTAVRSIRKGEELTLDFTTIMDRLRPPFKCHCSDGNCKRVITCDVPSMLQAQALQSSVDNEFYSQLLKAHAVSGEFKKKGLAGFARVTRGESPFQSVVFEAADESSSSKESSPVNSTTPRTIS